MSAFTRGALGYRPEVLRQQFVGRGKGTGGGAVIWTRRWPSAAEFERMGRAIEKADQIVKTALALPPESQFAAEHPENALAFIDDDDEAITVGDAWIAEAEAELERRRQIVEADRINRGLVMLDE